MVQWATALCTCARGLDMIETDETERAGGASVKSAKRVLSIFRYFEKVRTPKTLSEISQDLSYPVSSTLALLRSIQTLGYLTFSIDSKTYFPSIRFAMLGQWIHERLFEGGAVVAMMEALSASTEETVLLGIQNGLHSQHIHIVEAAQSLSYRPPIGTMRPLLRSAVGRVLLSGQPETSVLRAIERTNATGMDEGRTFEPATVMKDLAKVRKDGFAYSANLFTPGAAIVAVALPVREGELAMAVSVGGPSSRVDTKAIPTLVCKINAAIADMRADTARAGVDAQR